MPDELGRYIAIGIELFGIIFGLVLFAIIALGLFVRRYLAVWFKITLVVIGIIGFYAWSNYFVFPYSSIDGEPNWMFAGLELNEPAKNFLEEYPQYKDLSRQRLNEQLVADAGGDPEMVWIGRSMEVPKYLGQLALMAILFALASIIPSRPTKM